MINSPQNRNPSEILNRLSQIEILRALPPEEIQLLIPEIEPVIFSPGKRVIEQGAVGDAIYFIESGRARVKRNDSPQVWYVEVGSVIGEIALLTGETRTATVNAETELVT